MVFLAWLSLEIDVQVCFRLCPFLVSDVLICGTVVKLQQRKFANLFIVVLLAFPLSWIDVCDTVELLFLLSLTCIDLVNSWWLESGNL